MPEQNTREIDFNAMFHPRSIALFGASSNYTSKLNIASTFIGELLDFGYAGRIYPIGPNGGEVRGLPIYPNIQSVPGEVDFAMSVIPNVLVPQMVRDCGEKGVKIIHLFTSGFDEIEDRIGAALQQEILKIASSYGIRIIGPNCLGIYCPSSRMTYGKIFSSVEGNVGYLAQSGGQSTMGILEANRRGIYFSKSVSYGNAADINECDLLEYLSGDPETGIIAMYIEGTNDGPRFVKTLQAASRRKPVVIFKGADTDGGSQAALSHTSSIAGSRLTWATLIHQCGAIRVYNIQEMFDVIAVLQRCPVPGSLNTLVMGHGGGACVQASDDCYREGLEMPVFSAPLRQALTDIYESEAGNIFKNPLDINPYGGMEKAKTAFSVVADWDSIDIVMLLTTPEQTSIRDRGLKFEVTTNTTIEWARMSKKTTLLVLNTNTLAGDDGKPERAFQKMLDAGFAVFPSAKRAARAVSRVYAYYAWLHRHNT